MKLYMEKKKRKKILTIVSNNTEDKAILELNLEDCSCHYNLRYMEIW